MTDKALASQIPRVVLDVPGCDGLTVCVYGEVHAKTLKEELKQGYFVALDGQHVVRAELLDKEKSAIRALLKERFPEHAVI